MKKLLIIIIIFTLFFGLYLALNFKVKNSDQLSATKKIKVVTTLFPMYDFAKNIGQDKVDVLLLLPPGVEAHAYEPKPSDIVKINESNIFIYTGKYMEPWAEDVTKGLSNKNLKIIDSSLGLAMISSANNIESDSSNATDPHIWLNFNNDHIIIDAIAKALSEKDVDNKEFYLKNAEEYKTKLKQLDEQYSSVLGDCLRREIIYGGHYTFGYLAEKYNLQNFSAQGIAPDAEPSAKDLIKLVEQIKKDNLKYIFYEELASPKIAETLAAETGVKMLLLNSAHNLSKSDFLSNRSFLCIMEENLLNLKIGLQCK
jgi:zinc transport system substrate-binding protein